MWSGSDEVVALLTCIFKKGISNNTAYGVSASIVFIGIATTIAIPTCFRVV